LNYSHRPRIIPHQSKQKPNKSPNKKARRWQWNDQLDGFSCYKIFKDTNKTSYLNKDYILNVLRLVIDCNHFSVVSATTVGYGDMVPKSHFAKLIVDFQLTYTFAIVAIGIGKYSTEVKRSATQLGA
jgi:hypothetical protein